MEPTTQNNTLRSLLIFIVIGAVLLGAVILGVRWARGRSDQIANKNTTQVATTEKTPAEKKAEAERKAKEDQQKVQQAQPQPTQTQNTNSQVAATPAPAPQQSQPKTSSTSTVTNSPAHVPSTGMGDVLLPLAAIAATVFATTTYVQSRRRLGNIARIS